MQKQDSILKGKKKWSVGAKFYCHIHKQQKFTKITIKTIWQNKKMRNIYIESTFIG